MVKKRNKRTRKKYKKRGGFTNEQLDKCNIRLERQGVKSRVTRLKMCNDSNATADLDKQEPAPVQPDQTIAQPKQPTELKQSSGVQSVIAPLEEEPKKQKSQKIKDRASALAPQLANRTKGRKALRTTVGSCRVAVDKGIKYYYNEADEQTESPPGTPEFDKVCNPTEGIKKTGRTVGDYCIEATYKNGNPYLYKNDPDGFSTHDMNDPRCFAKKEIIVKGKYKSGVDNEIPFTPIFKAKKKTQEAKKVEEAKDELPACDTFNGRTCDLNRCVLEPKKAARGRTKKKPKQLKKKDRLCLDKKKGGKRTKRKKSRKKRKKSRKRRR